MSKPTIMLVSLAALNLKAGTQFREGLDAEAVKDYTKKLEEWKNANTQDAEGKPLANIPSMDKWTKCPLPAITVFETETDGTINVDGFHRIKAAKAAALDQFAAEVRKGTKEDAIAYALQANATHGVRLTDADKQNKLKAALKISQFKELSNNALANKIGVSEFFVRSHRPASAAPVTRTAVKKDGTTSKVDTSRIGKKGGKKKDAKKAKAKGKGKGAEKGTTGTSEGQTEEEKALAGALGDTPGKGKTFDEDTERAIKRIVKSVNDAGVTDGAALETAIRNGSIEISARDLKALAQTSPDRMVTAYPLVFGEKRMSPAQAFALMDKIPDANMKLGHLFNMQAARGGILREFSKEEGLVILIVPVENVIENKTIGSYFAFPADKKAEALAAIKEA